VSTPHVAKVIVMSPFAPQNPDFAEVVRASFARQGLMQALGIELVEVAPGRCVLEAAANPSLTQQQGFFHGALIGAMLDCAGGYAAYSLMPAGSERLCAVLLQSLIQVPANAP
jgi:acyl-coenzyme A thioesterase PaaI-like protein